MEQSNAIDRIKAWLEAQTLLARGAAIVGMLVVVSLLVVAIICLIAGWTTALELSNALFYASSVMFAVSLVLYFGGGRSLSSSKDKEKEEEADKAEDKDSLTGMMKRRRRDVPFHSITFITAGIVLFLLSMAVWYILP